MREHDVTALTAAELEAARRELAASLALARPGSPARTPILAPPGRHRHRANQPGHSAVWQPARLPARLASPGRDAG
jgi:hypothetical protein